jgi:hypothetical protein
MKKPAGSILLIVFIIFIAASLPARSPEITVPLRLDNY